MSDKVFDARSPGEMLRAAREKQGLHIAALAAAIKVAPRKLDALEHDRWDELPDATFVRALAQTVCRTLKIDPAPVMELLPRAGAAVLAPDSGGLNAPFRDRPGRDEPGLSVSAVRPMVLAAGLLMVAAVAVYFLPDRFWSGRLGTKATSAATGAESAASAATSAAALPEAAPAPEAAPMPAEAAASGSASGAQAAPLATAASAAAPADVVAPPAVTTAAAAPASAAVAAPTPAVAASATAMPAGAGVAQLRAKANSWIDARDASGKVLLSRLVLPGETLGLDGKLPLRLTIGNAAATELDFRGQAFDLKPVTRDNVARVELK